MAQRESQTWIFPFFLSPPSAINVYFSSDECLSLAVKNDVCTESDGKSRSYFVNVYIFSVLSPKCVCWS